MEWFTPEFALIDGAIEVLKGNYISKGQVTKYFYKFDVVGNEILRDNETKNYSIKNITAYECHNRLTDIDAIINTGSIATRQLYRPENERHPAVW